MDNYSKNINFGLLKDPADGRDLLWRAVVSPERILIPPRYERKSLGKVLDQKDKPYCVGYSTASLKMHHEFKEHHKYYLFDPEWLYKECKKVDGYDGDGTYLRIALQIIKDFGYIAKAKDNNLEKDASFKIDKYVRLTSKTQIKEAIFNIGPVVFGINVDEGIYKPVKGIIPEPEGEQLGGHAMIIVGYDDKKKCLGSIGAFKIKNSWGDKWAQRGFAWMPYSHFDTYKDWDAWRTVDSKDLIVQQ